MGAVAGVEVDHRDGNTLNNSRANLRCATKAQNQSNRAAAASNRSTGFKGVHMDDRGRFRAAIVANGVTYRLGHYDTAELAARAYDAKAIEVHGEFARLNFPMVV